MSRKDVFNLEKIEDFIKRNLVHLGIDPGLPEDMHKAAMQNEGIKIDATGAGWTIFRRTCRCDRSQECAHYFVHAQLGKKDILQQGVDRQYEDVLTIDPAPRKLIFVAPAFAGMAR